MPEDTTDLLIYYRRQSPVTDPREYAPAFSGLPADPTSLCRIVQGLHLHYMEGDLYGVAIPAERHEEMLLRGVDAMLARLLGQDPRPLTAPRPPECRLVGCCRDFAVMLCALLRHQGVPARVRYGFAAYIRHPDLKYCDHVVCECWRPEERRWTLADAQINDVLRRINVYTFDDPLDVPRDQFLTAGRAWQLCRSGGADPREFGYDADLRGLWVVQSYLVHEAASLCKREMQIGDAWGLGDRGDKDALTDEEMALLDRVAVLTLAADAAAVGELWTLLSSEPGLRLPERVKSWRQDGTFCADPLPPAMTGNSDQFPGGGAGAAERARI